ncbi:RNA polymerase sigma factor RpoE [Labilithrix luteola]|uniref:RNA polymerase sigma factor RpoE n=1 Tax=Labilithrix luteola TaxID=1391654 RepID=A0A0K1PW52_9BACT|nr:sigma-70 family RNA polymerase sigma factor [Labilithrix luteola]AKU97742.1 RNA polymerase sigma factor RpoE [Labilithrix luteola]
MSASPHIRGLHLQTDSSVSERPGATVELDTLFRENAPFIARSLRRLGVPASDVQDALQEVFVVAARKLDLITEGSGRAFLYSTAIRVASNARRSGRRAQSLRDEAIHEGVQLDVDVAPNAEEIVGRLQARAMLDAVLETMSDDMRAVFTLYELEEMTIAEISSLLGVPIGTVGSRLWRAREHFEQQLRVLRAQQGKKP